MKKILLTFFALFCFIPFVSAKKEPVKVYIFEAGGCPYCEAQIEYLEGLSSYEKEFVIVKKEAYVDHVDWEQGKDYELAKNVAEAFKKAGFEDATHQATPFVVISDLYAAAAYNTNLEETIKEAYEKGDKDIVKCIENGKDNCLKHLTKSSDSASGSVSVTVTIVICTLALAILYIVKSNKDTEKVIEQIKDNKK